MRRLALIACVLTAGALTAQDAPAAPATRRGAKTIIARGDNHLPLNQCAPRCILRA